MTTPFVDNRERETRKKSSRTLHLGLLPLLLFIALTALFRVFKPFTMVFEPPYLLPILNTAFLAVMPFTVAYFAGRSYLTTGSLSIFLIGCALFVFGAGNLVAGSLIDLPTPNSTLTVHNIASVVASILYVMAAFALAEGTTVRFAGRAKTKLFTAFSAILLFVVPLSVATVLGLMPVFFVVGSGPTPLREVVLAVAVILHALAAFFALRLYRQRRMSFLYWFGLALLLTATGLAAVLMQAAVGSPISWVGRVSQYVGGIFFLVAIIVVVRQARTAHTTVGTALASFFRESELHYKNLIEAAKDAIISTDSHGQIILWNSTAQTIFGFTRDEAVGSRLTDLLGLDDPTMTPLEKAGREEDRTKTVEATLIRKDGSVLFSELSATVAETANGKTTTFIIRDITERKRAEEALKKNLERLDIISNTAGQLLMSTEPQKVVEALCRRVMEHLDCHAFFNFLVDEERNCLRLNAYAGIPEETAREVHFLDFGAAVCGCAARDACRIVAENIPTTPDIRTDLVRSFGIKAYACHPLFAQGRVIGTLSFGTKSRLTLTEDELSLMKTVADQVATAMERVRLLRSAEERADELEEHVQERTAELTQAYKNLEREMAERAKIEDQLRQAHKMEAIGTLAGGIAHDFNNILAIIVGNAELAIDEVPEEMGARHNLTQIFKAGMRGRNLVRQILTFSRKAEHERKPLALSPLVKETFDMLRASLPTTIDMALDLKASDDVVLADGTQIQQVLMNLCKNAADAMREEGRHLEVTLAQTIFTEDMPLPESDMEPGGYVTLTVRDTGHGMDEEVKKKLFEPFFTTKQKGQGTGMGLAVVYGIVKAHHGTITVVSEPGQGSTFTVYLPKAVAAAVVQENAGIATIKAGHERILLVDDEKDIADAEEATLRSLDYQVTATRDSAEALRVFSETPDLFDLVVTDQNMPHLTGLDLAKRVLSIRPDVPVILCTGYSDIIPLHKAQAGIRGYITKPVTKRELAAAIRRVLDGQGRNSSEKK